jgi:hypothetical protein
MKPFPWNQLLWTLLGFLFMMEHNYIAEILCFMMIPLWNISDALMRGR